MLIHSLRRRAAAAPSPATYAIELQWSATSTRPRIDLSLSTITWDSDALPRFAPLRHLGHDDGAVQHTAGLHSIHLGVDPAQLPEDVTHVLFTLSSSDGGMLPVTLRGARAALLDPAGVNVFAFDLLEHREKTFVHLAMLSRTDDGWTANAHGDFGDQFGHAQQRVLRTLFG